ncbi:nonstructural protein [Sigmofec virus UA08Rod_4967]|uniref:Nonstructural protein n=1 Tax=Sigmofec virus UA08Rod_4967 TaxID=2929413 RepID=A0A976R5B9_9VIRU|nr:nonstructural protein [Sigmofec virus UA08Rod_4967]
MNVYAIKDEVIGFTGSIFTAQNDEAVIRNMTATVNAGDGNQMELWPKDFSAWQVATQDKVTGEIKPCQPRLICRGDSLKRGERKEESK